jgi:glucose-6-phosphate isomerase/transaldolase/glucose-6-phosphate isomerase
MADVERTLADLQRRDVVGRIWRGDHTVWKPQPREITDRLGWLTVSKAMHAKIAGLRAYADEVRDAGFRHVVLLGMGGSSLAPEVLRRTFGSADGFPELIVLDSTVPAWIRAVADAIDPAHTLFLVSSKSGGTVEPNVLYSYFRAMVDEAVGPDRAGNNFVAVTDPATSLVEMAQEKKFRKTFLNPPEIGGRYAVLSYFGLVPAALTGIDIAELLNRADRMAESCGANVPAQDNPGARLGATLASMAQRGRDKLTLVTSPSIESFGLWVEQLIAESTGKEGKGIVPVTGEPLLATEHYDDDRLFVYLRLENDDNAGTDAAVQAVEAAGHPMVRLILGDKYDLGAEFFRWEFATALAGAVLGIHPFDQPNVQQAKDMTATVLEGYEASAKMPETEVSGSPPNLLSQAARGEYLAIMAYIHQSPEVDRVLASLRQVVAEQTRLATTVGYGPRFLHSTAQLHKGGANNGLFLQLTTDHDPDVAIPGRRYTFGTLVDAQALGDLQALLESGRRVAKVHLGADPVSEINRLAAELT